MMSDVDVSGAGEGAGVVGGELDSWKVVGECGWGGDWSVGGKDRLEDVT